MIDQKQFVDNVIVPTLMHMNLHSKSAVQLLLGTALVESRLTYLRQLENGPARGLFQMEPATHDDIWNNYLKYKPGYQEKVEQLLAPEPNKIAQLATNLMYSAAMTRLHYRRVRAPLPDADDIPAMAFYWKQYYNTPLGAGKPAHFIEVMS